MSPSKQATQRCKRNSLSPGSRGRQQVQVLQYWVIIWTWLHFPETCFSTSQPLADRGHMDIFMLLAVLPEVTVLFFSPGKLGIVPGSIMDSSHPICILPYLPLEPISSPLCTNFAWKDVGGNLAIAVPCVAPGDTSVHHPQGRPELRQHLCCVKKWKCFFVVFWGFFLNLFLLFLREKTAGLVCPRKYIIKLQIACLGSLTLALTLKMNSHE